MRKTYFFLITIIFTGFTALFAQQPINKAQDGWRSIVDESSNPDMAYAFTASKPTTGQYDRNADGRIDLVISDRNGDGIPDYWATDRDFDGRVDDFQYDRNLDGRIDQWEYDIDHDGISDKIYVDTNGDGKADMYATLNPITRTYTWYGNMTEIQGSSHSAFPALTAPKSQFKGEIGDSF